MDVTAQIAAMELLEDAKCVMVVHSEVLHSDSEVYNVSFRHLRELSVKGTLEALAELIDLTLCDIPFIDGRLAELDGTGHNDSTTMKGATTAACRPSNYSLESIFYFLAFGSNLLFDRQDFLF